MDRLVRELVERQSFDAVQDFAVAFPLAVVPDLLGWPEDEGKKRLLEWASAEGAGARTLRFARPLPRGGGGPRGGGRDRGRGDPGGGVTGHTP
ncbi:hypothetical protein ACFV4S_04925, partial [Streptomyces sp. NPDC059742]